MNTIALETSVQPGSLALFRDETVVHACAFPANQRTAETFAAQIDLGLQTLGWNPKDVDLFVVCRGPGSFTGLRIGVTAGKTFAYATRCELLALDTLEVIAAQLPSHNAESWVVMDAQRRQFYAASFRIAGSQVTWTSPTRIIDESELLESVSAGDQIAGPALSRCRDRLAARARVVDERLWNPTAEALGRLGLSRFESGERDDFWRVTPQYFRKSAAEEKWKQPSQ